jgi:RNA polymerase sigma-70 factor (family 1)
MPDINLQMENDKVLFNRIAEGDQEAFRALFDKFVPRMRPAIRAITGDEVPVKDIIQDIFLLLWVNREKLMVVESPENWLFRMVHYECYKWLRKKKLQDKTSKQLVQETALHEYSTGEYINFLQTSKLIKEAVASLPTQARKVYQLRREANMSPGEISRELSVSEKTVKNTLTRALKFIQDYLRERDVIVPILVLEILTSGLR